MGYVVQPKGGKWGKITGTLSNQIDLHAELGARQRADYVFFNTTERGAFFVANPHLLVEDSLITIKDTTPPPISGIRGLNFNKEHNSQYMALVF